MRQYHTPAKDRYAELLAQGKSRADIASTMGLTRGQAAGLWRRIKQDLGEQAR